MLPFSIFMFPAGGAYGISLRSMPLEPMGCSRAPREVSDCLSRRTLVTIGAVVDDQVWPRPMEFEDGGTNSRRL